MIKKKAFGVIDAVTDFGGLLVLFSGTSIISMIQLLVNILHSVITWRKNGDNALAKNKNSNIPRIFTKFSSKLRHLKRDVKDFIKMSSIHGVSNFSRGFTSKIFWSAVIVLAASTFVTFVHELSNGLDGNRVFMRVDDKIWTDNEVFE